ncbi:radical SAM protein [Patescibacteria group bacterium]
MDLYQKISILGPSAQYDTCGPKDFGQTTKIPGVYEAKVGGGHVCKLFKVLQTNSCRNNCHYCAFRRDRNCKRTSTTPEEMARAFSSAYSRRLVQGLFLSSGIAGTADQTMSRMIDTASIIRQKYGYRGYIHLKLMPGTSLASIEETANLANRISLNIEAPTEKSLVQLSPEKTLRKGFFYTLSQIKKVFQKRKFKGKRNPSLTTQFVVGAGREGDSEIMKTTHFLYKAFSFKRVFYSAFRPVAQTPLENRPAVSLTREHRLYQADFLMRFYRFLPHDIPVDQNGFLSETTDPKTLWAKQHPEFFPININRASYWTLLKVPGIGPISAQRILKRRRKGRVSSLKTFANQRFQINKISAYVRV